MTGFTGEELLKVLKTLPPEEMIGFIREMAKTLSPEKLTELIAFMAGDSPAPLTVASAATVRMTGEIIKPHYSGTTLVDPFNIKSDNRHPSFRIGEFQALYGGGDITVFGANEEGEPHILLVRPKSVDYWKDANNLWMLPAGFMDPKPAHNPLGVWGVDNDGRPVTKPPAHDKTMKQTALRKLADKTGLKLSDYGIKDDEVRFVGNYIGDIHIPEQRQERQQVTELHYLDARRLGYLPKVEVTAGTNVVDYAAWIPLKALKVAKDPDGNITAIVPEIMVGDKKIASLPIDPLYFVPRVEASLATMRDEEVAKHGIVRRSLIEGIKGEKPLCELDPAAFEFHEKVMAKAIEIEKLIQPQLGNAI